MITMFSPDSRDVESIQAFNHYETKAYCEDVADTFRGLRRNWTAQRVRYDCVRGMSKGGYDEK